MRRTRSHRLVLFIFIGTVQTAIVRKYARVNRIFYGIRFERRHVSGGENNMVVR